MYLLSNRTPPHPHPQPIRHLSPLAEQLPSGEGEGPSCTQTAAYMASGGSVTHWEGQRYPPLSGHMSSQMPLIGCDDHGNISLRTRDLQSVTRQSHVNKYQLSINDK